MFALSSSSTAYKFVLPPFRHHAGVCPFHLSLLLCSLSCHCLSAMSSFLSDLHFCNHYHLFPKLYFFGLFICRQLATRDPQFASPFATVPIFIGTLVSIFLFLAVGTVATSSQDLFLDCEHLFLISEYAAPVLEFLHLIDERPQDVVELHNVFGSVSFRGVADQ